MRTRGLFLILATFVLTMSALADPVSDFKKWHANGIKQLRNAFLKEDIKFFEKYSTANFKYVTIDGKSEGRAAAMEGLKQMFMMMDITSIDTKVGKVTVKGDTATVESTSTYKGKMMPMGKGDTKAHDVKMTEYVRQTWKKSGKDWKLAEIKETKKGKFYMDGKEVDPSKIG